MRPVWAWNWTGEQVQKAHEAYKRLPVGARNDAGPMQYLIPGWTFDRKRPVFGRH